PWVETTIHAVLATTPATAAPPTTARSDRPALSASATAPTRTSGQSRYSCSSTERLQAWRNGLGSLAQYDCPPAWRQFAHHVSVAKPTPASAPGCGTGQPTARAPTRTVGTTRSTAGASRRTRRAQKTRRDAPPPSSPPSPASASASRREVTRNPDSTKKTS